jgi:hypothetical protein
MGDKQAHRQHVGPISLLVFPAGKDSTPNKMKYWVVEEKIISKLKGYLITHSVFFFQF